MEPAHYSREDFASEPDVSRETLHYFDAWLTLLQKWNRTINLVSPSAMDTFWRRHALDSWQIAGLMPQRVMNAIDLGSGAGFPGVAVAIALAERGQGRVLLVESAGKKANFLRTVARDLQLPIDVTTERAECLPAQPFDLITARAFAPLPRLLTYAAPFWGPRTVGLFSKGEGVAHEIAVACEDWEFDSRSHPSRSSDEGTVLEMRGLAKRDAMAQTPTHLD